MHEQICQALGLDARFWPPDHYTLLGLKPGESDSQIIEQRVHERMRQLRPYQLSYPDQTTEAMNRLAQAYGCLMDPVARKTYDDSLLLPPPQPFPALPGGESALRGPAAAGKESAPGIENGSVNSKDPLAWLFGPWDSLADAQPSAGASGARPHFRDWTAATPPPNKRRSMLADHDEPILDIPAASSAFEEAQPLTSQSFFWKHSGILLVVLSLLALLTAAWRTFRP